MHWLVGAVLVLVAETAAAETITNCNALPDGQRLDCYDRVLGVLPPLLDGVNRAEPCADQIQHWREAEYARIRKRQEPPLPPPPCMVELNRNRQGEMTRARAMAEDRELMRGRSYEAEQARIESVRVCARPEMQEAVLHGRIVLGMTARELSCSAGAPSQVNRTTGASGISEQWVYGTYSAYISPRYVYLRNGLVEAIQE